MEEFTMRAFKTLITHAKNFHADDVFSTALLAVLTKRETYELNVIRSNYPYKELSEDILNDPENIMYDIGRGKFDHHQADSPVRENGIKYAAFGLLWKEFGDWDKYPDFDRDFVSKIDDHDNGGKMNEMSLVIRSFNPSSMELNGLSEEEQIKIYDRQFYKAVAFAKDYIDNLFKNYDELNHSKEYIEKNAEFFLWTKDLSGKKTIMILPEYVGKLDDIILDYYKDVVAVIYPSNRGGYAAKVIPKDKNTMESYYTFPYIWCGAEPDNLPSDVQFCHKSGFLATFKTLEMAEMYTVHDLSTHAVEKHCIFKDESNFMDDFVKLDVNAERIYQAVSSVASTNPAGRRYNPICVTLCTIDGTNIDVVINIHRYNELVKHVNITPCCNIYEDFHIAANVVFDDNVSFDDIEINYWFYTKTDAID